MAAGRFAQAVTLLQRLNQQHPDRPEVLALLITALARSGRGPQAAYYGAHARTVAAGRPEDLTDLGDLLASLGLADEAVAAYGSALDARPGFGPASVGLSACHLRAFRLADAARVCRAALERHPRDVQLRGNLGVALLQSGRAAEAVAVLREAAADAPDEPTIVSAYAAATNYDAAVSREESLRAHRALGDLYERRRPAPASRRPADPDPERPLRVGIVSADLRAHPCGTFIEPWLAKHNPAGFAITCYSVGHEDAATRRLRAHPVAWRHVPRLGSEALAEQIRADGIDIAIDLSGQTAGHRLAALHTRPAPVQATYFGYPSTTGVPGIDARFVDSITDPPGADAFATERLVRLDPCFLCFPPAPGAPDPGPLPALEAGRITFGSFNNIAKIDPRTIALWGAVLRAVPGSRLMLKYHALSQREVRADLLDRLGAGGVEPHRVVLDEPGRTTLETLAAYQRVDIGLDTFPYHGTTTTCEALFMGVPVVTLLGEPCAARVSASILSAAGEPGWIARTDDEFASIAAGLASDVGALARRRAGLRGSILASPLCDQEAFIARFEGALRALWREACARP